VVVKAAGDRRSEIRTALAERAKHLGLGEIDDDQLDALVDEAVEAEDGGEAFEATAWDARLRAAAPKSDGGKQKPQRHGGHQRGTRGRAPKPRGGDSAVTSESGNSAQVQMAKDRLDSAIQRRREAFLASETGAERVAANARVLRSESPGMSEAEAIAKATAAAVGGAGVAAVIKAVATALVEDGMPKGEAEVLAGRTVGARLSQQLRQRESGKVSKSVDPEVAKVGTLIRMCRIAKGLSQAQLGAEIGGGVSDSLVGEWEAGRHLPAGLHVWHLANALDAGRDLVDKINQAREGR
jgi:ribosome-binding protein aMBF1 (putative translation factor)